MDKSTSNSVDAQGILRGVWRRHKLLVIGLFLLLAIPGLVAVYYFNKPLYVSTGTVAVGASPIEQFALSRETPRPEGFATYLSLL